MAIAVGSITAMDGNQKSENYGYYEKETSTDNKVNKSAEVVTSNTKATTLAPSANNNTKPSKVETVKVEKPTTPSKVNGADHSAFDGLLKAHVSDSGAVDYAAIKGKVAVLDKYQTRILD